MNGDEQSLLRETVGVWLEKIPPEDARYAQEQFGVDAVTVEDLIDICAVASKLPGEPHH